MSEHRFQLHPYWLILDWIKLTANMPAPARRTAAGSAAPTREYGHPPNGPPAQQPSSPTRCTAGRKPAPNTSTRRHRRRPTPSSPSASPPHGATSIHAPQHCSNTRATTPPRTSANFTTRSDPPSATPDPATSYPRHASPVDSAHSPAQQPCPGTSRLHPLRSLRPHHPRHRLPAAHPRSTRQNHRPG